LDHSQFSHLSFVVKSLTLLDQFIIKAKIEDDIHIISCEFSMDDYKPSTAALQHQDRLISLLSRSLFDPLLARAAILQHNMNVRSSLLELIEGQDPGQESIVSPSDAIIYVIHQMMGKDGFELSAIGSGPNREELTSLPLKWNEPDSAGVLCMEYRTSSSSSALPLHVSLKFMSLDDRLIVSATHQGSNEFDGKVPQMTLHVSTYVDVAALERFRSFKSSSSSTTPTPSLAVCYRGLSELYLSFRTRISQRVLEPFYHDSNQSQQVQQIQVLATHSPLVHRRFIYNLPNHTILEILSFLGSIELSRVARVSVMFRTVCDSPWLWRQLCQTELSFTPDENASTHFRNQFLIRWYQQRRPPSRPLPAARIDWEEDHAAWRRSVRQVFPPPPFSWE